MRQPPLGTGLRTTLLFVAIASVTVTTWLWQFLFARPEVGLPEAVAAIVLPAAVGVISGYYAICG
jgi:hypothetical protein